MPSHGVLWGSKAFGNVQLLGLVLGILVFIIFSLHGKDTLQAHLKKALVSSTWGKQSFFPLIQSFLFFGHGSPEFL